MEGGAEAVVIPVHLQRDWYCIFNCSDSIFYMILNDFTSWVWPMSCFFPPQFMMCEFQTLLLHSHLSFLFLYITPNTDSMHPTYHHGVSMVTGLPHFFFSKLGGLVALECDVLHRVLFLSNVNDMTDRALWKLSLWDVVLPMNSIPSWSPASFTSMKHVKRGGSEGRRDEKREREQRTQPLQCSRGFVLFRIHLRESHMV